jgi:hypothetical protein
MYTKDNQSNAHCQSKNLVNWNSNLEVRFYLKESFVAAAKNTGRLLR